MRQKMSKKDMVGHRMAGGRFMSGIEHAGTGGAVTGMSPDTFVNGRIKSVHYPTPSNSRNQPSKLMSHGPLAGGMVNKNINPKPRPAGARIPTQASYGSVKETLHTMPSHNPKAYANGGVVGPLAQHFEEGGEVTKTKSAIDKYLEGGGRSDAPLSYFNTQQPVDYRKLALARGNLRQNSDAATLRQADLNARDALSSNSTSTHNFGDPNNPDPFRISYGSDYDRKSAGLPSFIPGAAFLNPLLGLGIEDTPERAAERAYNQANPGQDDGLVNRYLGTGKWETVHPTDVSHTQSIGNDRKGYGEVNESGLGRDTNYDRFGNIRTEIPDNIDSGSVYWNSTTGAWTDKSTGVPVGGSINDPNSTPDVVKAQAIQDTLAEQARQKAAGEAAAAALVVRQQENNRDRESQAQKDAQAAVRAQLSVQAAKDNVTASGHINNPFEAQRTDTNNKSSNSSSSSSSSGGTHCCTAALKQGRMGIRQVQELRKWHRSRSELWQNGYDVYGKFIADNLVSGSDFWSDVTAAGHTFFVERRVTPMSLLAYVAIAPGSYATGLSLELKSKVKEMFSHA